MFTIDEETDSVQSEYLAKEEVPPIKRIELEREVDEILARLNSTSTNWR